MANRITITTDQRALIRNIRKNKKSSSALLRASKKDFFNIETCGICLTEYEPEEMHKIKNCDSSFCKDVSVIKIKNSRVLI